MIGGFLRRLPGGRDRGPAPRLTAGEAERIARGAVATSPLADRLVLRGRWVEAGRLAWHFWTPTRGTMLSIRVDDATGEPHVEQDGSAASARLPPSRRR